MKEENCVGCEKRFKRNNAEGNRIAYKGMWWKSKPFYHMHNIHLTFLFSQLPAIDIFVTEITDNFQFYSISIAQYIGMPVEAFVLNQ